MAHRVADESVDVHTEWGVSGGQKPRVPAPASPSIRRGRRCP
ncbi:hypothetical protein MBEHAL_0706 [Halarchaeum acidiphilum MH1-52-1]|uniref:Uncharacterized protein n=1 Tax=Halarchaeum acidiphilum MH1-52-1 TaxID=1261545 RepID=U2YE05_9EURY|nr:hypothetical protein MBEHAL_0706 [Halarchaeum acidiphilum MH1-52-1]